MKKLSAEERRKQLLAIAAIKDEDIDCSDIPELTAEQFRTGVRGLFYRHAKESRGTAANTASRKRKSGTR